MGFQVCEVHFSGTFYLRNSSLWLAYVCKSNGASILRCLLVADGDISAFLKTCFCKLQVILCVFNVFFSGCSMVFWWFVLRTALIFGHFGPYPLITFGEYLHDFFQGSFWQYLAKCWDIWPQKCLVELLIDETPCDDSWVSSRAPLASPHRDLTMDWFLLKYRAFENPTLVVFMVVDATPVRIHQKAVPFGGVGRLLLTRRLLRVAPKL